MTCGEGRRSWEETYQIRVGCLCSLQLCDRHISKFDSVMRVYDDLRAKAGVMGVTQYKRRCVLREQSLIKRKLILIGVEVCDRFLTEAYRFLPRRLKCHSCPQSGNHFRFRLLKFYFRLEHRPWHRRNFQYSRLSQSQFL